MPLGVAEREQAIAAADGTCPRCGTPREHDQRYCLECGLALPQVSGRVPALRRRWLRRVGWYPGDWVWISLLTLVVATAGAAVAIALTARSRAQAGETFVATTDLTVREPTAVPATTAAPIDTSTLPTAPEAPATVAKPAAGSKGRSFAWPLNGNGWTVVLVSYPKRNGRPAALATAAKASRAGLRQVGMLDSGRYASLQPGYLVVFSGVYGSKADADGAVATARQAGFGGAYSRQIAR